MNISGAMHDVHIKVSIWRNYLSVWVFSFAAIFRVLVEMTLAELIIFSVSLSPMQNKLGIIII